VIDNLGPNGAAFVSRAVARRSARAQTGYLYHYAFSMIIGLLVLVSWLLYTVNR
jgi:NADH-quinone oxidoreductase subunit L